MPTAPTPRATRQARALLRDDPGLSWPEILGEVCCHYHLSPAELARTGHHALARGVAAWLGRRYTSIGSGELSRQLGYCRPECLAGILRRLELLRARGGEVDRDLDAIRDRLRLPRDAR